MKGNRSLSLLLILLGIILHTACNKEDKNVGIDVQPSNDRLNVFYTDTLTVSSYSLLVDSVRTDETSSTLLGSLNDPIFGTTTANLFTQFRLSQSAVAFGTDRVLDSLILTLDYNGLYGDSNAVLTLEVYEMSEKIFPDSSYYSNMSVGYHPELIASKTFTPNLRDSVVVGSDTLKPHFRINLSQTNTAFAQKLLDATDENLNTQDDFQNYFYGLYLKIRDVSQGGAIMYISLLDAMTEMTLYFSNAEDDSLSYDFIISSYAAYFGQFKHNYSMAQPVFKAQVIDGDTTYGKNTCYIQAMAGVKTFIRFPSLKNLNDNGIIAVNEARLFIKLQEENPAYSPARSLVLVRSDGEGGYDILTDQLEGQDYFGGRYDTTRREYWFRISTSIQEILSNEVQDYGFELLISGGSILAERSILTGSAPQLPVPYEDRMRLVITYTKLE